jgi:hypothetical protein
MKEFEAIMNRHGEVGVQAILEDWERSQSLREALILPLEERWARFMRETNDNAARLAA